jgi:hypothetical protein
MADTFMGKGYEGAIEERHIVFLIFNLGWTLNQKRTAGAIYTDRLKTRLICKY